MSYSSKDRDISNKKIINRAINKDIIQTNIFFIIKILVESIDKVFKFVFYESND